MSEIQVLNSATIDKIAAGEVVERPAGVVKELVENAIDAGASAVTVEIKEGGLSLIRVTDNGEGIPAGQVRTAFLRHSTSKIREEKDLRHICSLGFRGEALSSIAAVARVEMMTKPRGELTGVHYTIADGVETGFSAAGVPEGKTVLVSQLFFHTPARNKFLKTAVTEGGYVAELCERLAMSRPEISFRFIANGQVKFHTSGSGDVKEIIYRIFGRQFMEEILIMEAGREGVRLNGYLGKPILNRSNRNFEHCFVNGRFIRSSLLSKAVEEGYRPYLMQHKFPFFLLYIEIEPERIDVNVHPAKMDIRFAEQQDFFSFLSKSVREALGQRELIYDMDLARRGKREPLPEPLSRKELPEPFEERRAARLQVRESMDYQAGPSRDGPLSQPGPFEDKLISQPSLFEGKILREDNLPRFQIIGQVFDTYWLILYENKLLFVDQHSAHEKVKYEKLMADHEKGERVTQNLHPPLVLSLTQKEQAVLEEFKPYFQDLGFAWENFGSGSVAVREIPLELYGKNKESLFREILDELTVSGGKGAPRAIREKIISLSCKAAVKGNNAMSEAEMRTLLEQLLTLENPYHCPHGRPTMTAMTRQELDKKFKRIV